MNSRMETLRKAERWLVDAERTLLTAMLAVMVTLSFLQVVLRAAFSSGLLWADTFLRHLVLWVGFLGAATAASADRQFAMDAAVGLLPGRGKAAARCAVDLFAASVCALLTRASWRFFLDERAAGSVLFMLGTLRVETWVFEAILPGGFLLLCAHYLLRAGLRLGEDG